MYNDTLDILTLIIGDSAHFPQGLLGKSPEVKLFLQRLSVGGRALHTLFQTHSVLAHHSCLQRWDYNQHCRISCKNQKDVLFPPEAQARGTHCMDLSLHPSSVQPTEFRKMSKPNLNLATAQKPKVPTKKPMSAVVSLI